jgi:hypothetical protein
MVEQLANDQSEHGVAEEFEALVGSQPAVGPGGVGQGLDEQLRILEPVAEHLFAVAVQRVVVILSLASRFA